MQVLRPGRLALANFLLPLLTVHVCYVLAASHGHVPWCIPYLDDCTSISATGRSMPEYLVFKLGMISAGLTKIQFWRLNRDWLDYLGDVPSATRRGLPILGLVAGLSLILYTVALGHEGAIPYLMRRLGVSLYFGLAFIAQCLLTLRLRSMQRQQTLVVSRKLLATILTILWILLVIGIGMVLLDLVTDFKERLEDPMEWLMALLMTLNYGLFWLAWRQSGFDQRH